MNRWTGRALDRGRIPAGRRDDNWIHLLPEKAEGFTKRPSEAFPSLFFTAA